jgi:HAD superfamily hydrolase (TIGR01509 family)
MPQHIKGIIFDLDGLMVDSEPVQLKAINDALKPLGICVEETEFIDMVGRKAIENFIALKEKHGFTRSPEELEQQKNLAYMERIRTELKPMPGLVHALDLCRDEKLIAAIASSSPRPDILAVLELLGLTNRFSVIASGDMVKRGKPWPDVFLKAAEMLGTAPSTLLVLEDTAHGVNAAKAAGMFCIAIPNHYTRGQDFFNADKVLDSLEELDMNIIKDLVSKVPKVR